MQESKLTEYNELLGEYKKQTANDKYKVDVRNIVVVEPENQRIVYKDIEALAISIRDFGLIHPLTVSSIRGTDKYELVDGFRRMRAIKLLLEWGIPFGMVEVNVVKGVTPEKKVAMMLVTGVQKQTLHAVEQAEAFLKLKNFGWDVAKIAAAISTPDGEETSEGKANAKKNLVYRYLKLAEYAPMSVKLACIEGKISHDTVIKMIELSLKETQTDTELAEKVSKGVFEAIERNTVVSDDGSTKTKKVKTGDVLKKVVAPKEKTFLEKLRVVSDELFSKDTDTGLLDAIIKLENASVEELESFFKKVAQMGKFEA